MRSDDPDNPTKLRKGKLGFGWRYEMLLLCCLCNVPQLSTVKHLTTELGCPKSFTDVRHWTQLLLHLLAECQPSCSPRRLAAPPRVRHPARGARKGGYSFSLCCPDTGGSKFFSCHNVNCQCGARNESSLMLETGFFSLATRTNDIVSIGVRQIQCDHTLTWARRPSPTIPDASRL